MSKQPPKDAIFKALADPSRRRILKMLGDSEMSAGEIASHFEMSAPSMSHHFNVLKSAGLIRTRREGQQIFYSLDTTVVQDLLTALLDLFQGKEQTYEAS